MKLGIIIAVLLVLGMGLLIFVVARGTPDEPTTATSPAKLKKVELPASLPVMFTTTNPTADANAAYQRAFAFYQEHKTDFDYYTKDPEEQKRLAPPTELDAQLTALLVEAMRAGQVDKLFLDEQLPMRPGAVAEFGGALEIVPTAVLSHATTLFDKKDFDHGLEASQACWALGQRAFQNCVRFYNRYYGVVIMESTANTVSNVYENVQDKMKIEPWVKPLQDVEASWNPKKMLVFAIQPNIGDLLNIAENDQDLTWRVEAVARMGIAKFNPGHRGNLRAIRSVIAQAKQSTEPMLVKAGEAADAFTVQELRRMK